VIQLTCLRAAALGLRRASSLLGLSLALAGIGACNERPADVREWRASDHDHTDNPSSGQVQVDPKDAGGPAVPGLEDVTIVAWSQNCTQCHGQLGRGDGPRGPMLKATNLSDPAWQSTVTDEQIGASIKLGKGAMPSFRQLPDVTIANLVKLVRMMNVARLQAHPDASAAPPTSATPSPSAVGRPTPKSAASAVGTTPKPSAAPLPSPSAR
jgi:mono/diheme cytochrome c family protein